MANPVQSIRRAMSRLFSGYKVNEVTGEASLWKQLMDYYQQNGLYDDLMEAAYYLDTWHDAMKPLRNPANRSVEFFVAKLMPGVLPDALPIVTENESIIEPIQSVWEWSNLNEKKPSVLRHYSIYGNIFLHPVSSEDGTRVYLQFLDPMYLTDFTKDDSGNMLTARVDIPQDGSKWWTEYWTTEGCWMWENSMNPSTRIEDLGDPVYSASLSEFGIDFCPFVHVQFRNIGEKWGWGAFQHCLDKIDEANRMATRLHQMIFRYNKPLWALTSNAVDSMNRPVPAPRIGGSNSDKLEIEDDTLVRLPGVSTLTPLIPNVNYAALAAVLDGQMAEIEKDLPELRYYELSKQNNLSGIAIRLLLNDAIDRAEEARANFEAGLIRAESMALTMGSYLGIFSGIGNDNAHSYQQREIFPVSKTEKAATLLVLKNAGVTGEGAMRMAGYTDDEVTTMMPAVQPGVTGSFGMPVAPLVN